MSWEHYPKASVEGLRERLKKEKPRPRRVARTPNQGRPLSKITTPSEILFEMQLQSRGTIEIDIAIRTLDPFRYERKPIGEPTRIIGLEPGEIMKLRRDIEGFLIWWRGELAIERGTAAGVLERMKIVNAGDK